MLIKLTALLHIQHHISSETPRVFTIVIQWLNIARVGKVDDKQSVVLL